ncbi:MAG TPA: cysteine desulfurase family protein [Polyangiaceae bacterium]|nr:cysteine desulfurase family protein [Polyangiaceae bacterium]
MGSLYFDHFATTPLDRRVLDAMLPYLQEDFGNPASTFHLFGQRAKDAAQHARRILAQEVGCTSNGVIFTSGATESNNLALRGVADKLGHARQHLIVSSIEHKSVLEPAKLLARQGFWVTYVPVDKQGLVDPERIAGAITQDTLLISVMAVNNEIGSIQPLEAVGNVARQHGVLFHCDATQGLGKVPIDMQRQGINLLSLSAHKLYGPKGVGALCVYGHEPAELLEPLALGGGQENRLRSGTLNVPGIVGLATAAELMRAHAPEEQMRLRSLRDALRRGLEKAIDGIAINGDLDYAIPSALNLSIEGIRSSALLARIREVGVSGAAACGGQSAKSHVLGALGLDRNRIQTALRFGLGRFNTAEDVAEVIVRIAAEVSWIRRQPRFDLEKAS